MELPRFVALKSNYNHKYLRYIHEDGEVHGFLQFSGDEVVSPYAKFEVETAKTKRGLLNIRCCYNNKYLRSWSPNHWWIVAGADEPEEDQSKWSCTLFEPIYAHKDAKTVQFRHVQLGHYACLWRAHPPYTNCLFGGAKTPDKDQCDVYTVIDWESLLILPKHVAFKGDNGKLLIAYWIEGHQYLQFDANDIGNPNVGMEVFTMADGTVRIKSDRFGKFWRRSPNWIWADSDDTTNKNPDTLFWPVKVSKNVIALRNLGNNNFCKRLTTEGKTSCLNAGVGTISWEARLQVHELVISRSIYNVNFRLMHSRIYDQSVLTMATGDAINRTQEPNNIDVKLSYTKSTSSAWDASVSLKLGVETELRARYARILDGKVKVVAAFTGTYHWEESQTSETRVETVYKVNVPPMTMVRVSLLATKGTCDVPFSYSQRDTLTNGKQVTYHKDDGLYTGINSFNFKYETKQEKL